MIDDPHAQTRAILWCLADLDPGMPVIEALGYLRVIEANLDARKVSDDDGSRLDPRYSGKNGVPNLILDMAAMGSVADVARRGTKGDVAREIVKVLGPGRVAATTALGAAESLVNMYQAT